MEFSRSLPTEILKTMRCAERSSFVCIEWLRIVCLSPRVEEQNSEVKKYKKRLYLNNGVACVFESVCIFITAI